MVKGTHAAAVITPSRSLEALERRNLAKQEEIRKHQQEEADRVAMAALKAAEQTATKAAIQTDQSMADTHVVSAEKTDARGFKLPPKEQVDSDSSDTYALCLPETKLVDHRGRKLASIEHHQIYDEYPLHKPGDNFIHDDLPAMQAVDFVDPTGAVTSGQQFKRLFGLLKSEVKKGRLREGDLQDQAKPIRELMKTQELYTPLLSSIMDKADIATSQLGRCIDRKNNILQRIVVLRDQDGRPLSIGVSEIALDRLQGNDKLEKFRDLISNTEVPVGAALIAAGLAEQIETKIQGRYRFPVGGAFADDFVSSVLDIAQNQEYMASYTLDSGKPRLVVPETLNFTRPGFDYVVGRMKVLSIANGSKKRPFGRFFDIPVIGLEEEFLPSHVHKDRSLVSVKAMQRRRAAREEEIQRRNEFLRSDVTKSRAKRSGINKPR